MTFMVLMTSIKFMRVCGDGKMCLWVVASMSWGGLVSHVAFYRLHETHRGVAHRKGMHSSLGSVCEFLPIWFRVGLRQQRLHVQPWTTFEGDD